MKKLIAAIILVAAVFMANSVSWGSEAETATWESATWETATWETVDAFGGVFE